jgi:hypothetical protein
VKLGFTPLYDRMYMNAGKGMVRIGQFALKQHSKNMELISEDPSMQWPYGYFLELTLFF